MEIIQYIIVLNVNDLSKWNFLLRIPNIILKKSDSDKCC